MNGVEFLFALSAVFGMTSLHFVWIRFVYKIENISKKKKKSPSISSPKQEIFDDIIDYDGMGQGRIVSQNRR